MANEIVRRTILMLATLAQLGVAIAMIFFIRRLSDVEIDSATGQVQEMTCSLNAGTGGASNFEVTSLPAKDLEDESLCILAYTGASVTLLSMFFLSVLLCLTCNLCGVGWILEVIVQGLLCTAWVIYSIWVTEAARTIDGWDTVPEWDTDKVQNARSTVVALSWAEAFLTGLVGLTILTLACCGRRSDSDRKAAWVGDNRV